MFDVPYGVFECFTNATTAILKNSKINPVELYKFNWDFFYNSQYDFISGNVDNLVLLQFARNHYGMEFQELEFGDIPDHEYTIVALNSFYVPYMTDLYQIADQLHYVIARKQKDEFEIIDPFYKIQEKFSGKDVHELWSFYSKPVIQIDVSSAGKPSSATAEVVPYILTLDYPHQYESVFQLLSSSLGGIDFGASKNFLESPLFKRYFSSIRTVLKNRETFFEVEKINKASITNVLTGWQAVLKELIKLSSTRRTSGLVDSFERAIHHEVHFLNSFKAIHM
ncbi:hypothetical protein [Paenibacillus lutrae]|uniref:Butirosin biosynthesis protein H N-terminal domain-containing protein n=1 Tax=Paenibacillus lutrae TaxID=2078573 RepID=A0A7X3FF87_9BACL|nr:hypothetical protein [Paenibacillus lutrae]MVO98635.1 hypothetical protein [Paenibacillus lutrae]